ncbi:MAG: hypothetical protein CMI16_02695 [Opitutaceae bacterium]|nr:hypothetical protein [Opitutaceae bacterium]
MADAENLKPSSICYRQFGASCLNVVVQLIYVVIFCVFALWATAAALEVLHLIDVSTVPPGLKYVPYLHHDGNVY